MSKFDASIDRDANREVISANEAFRSAKTVAFGINTGGRAAATATLTSNNTNVSANDTVTLGATTYKFVSPLTGAANEVLIGADADTSLANLASAINGSAGAGTTYGTGTVANASATSTATATSHVLTFTAITAGLAGNSITFSRSAVTLTVAAFSGGTDYTTLFTVTGTVLIALLAVCRKNLVGAGATLKVGVNSSDATLIAQTTATSIQNGKTWIDNSPGSGKALPGVQIITNSENVIMTLATANVTDGTVDLYALWRPLSSDGNVIAA